MARAGWFVAGLVIGAVVLAPLGAYLFVKLGGLSMATSAKPLPLEETFASAALRASLDDAAKVQDPLAMDEANLLGGVHVYRQDCAGCHGLPGYQKTAIAQGEFPAPPQLFEANHMVTDDPEGVTHWKVSNGIRLSGMPGFEKALSDTERWQVTMLLAHADKLPSAAKKALTEGAIEANVSASR